MTIQSSPIRVPIPIPLAECIPQTEKKSIPQAERKAECIAEQRRVRIAKLMAEASLHRRGWQAEIARQLDVHRCTVHRDVQVIRETWRQHRANTNRNQEIQRDRFAAMILASTGDRP